MSIDQAVGREIRVALVRRDMTPTDLAHKLNMDPSAVRRKLAGQRRITVEDLYDVARALKVEPGQLLPHLDSNQKPFD